MHEPRSRCRSRIGPGRRTPPRPVLRGPRPPLALSRAGLAGCQGGRGPPPPGVPRQRRVARQADHGQTSSATTATWSRAGSPPEGPAHRRRPPTACWRRGGQQGRPETDGRDRGGRGASSSRGSSPRPRPPSPPLEQKSDRSPSRSTPGAARPTRTKTLWWPREGRAGLHQAQGRPAPGARSACTTWPNASTSRASSSPPTTPTRGS